MKLTVIVPAYNGAKTLKRAVDSLLCQTMQDLEVIIINDGGKDDTAQIANQYAERDPRVKVVHKAKNEGLSAGRNSGMAIAQGEYITFLDC
ncbi:MAG: glycosyltransferase family 2 protein, partial [Oscillospiraceae bacterium]|nr:glycosyltransferase family 2 protein [Oscillospiraceae bacterium]